VGENDGAGDCAVMMVSHLSILSIDITVINVSVLVLSWFPHRNGLIVSSEHLDGCPLVGKGTY
jgi:hypothetical protein